MGIFDRLKRKKRKPSFKGPTEEAWRIFCDEKRANMDRILGKAADVVARSNTPFGRDGNVDLYYYPNGIPGMGLATQDLTILGFRSPKTERIGCYELVAFTKMDFDPTQVIGDSKLGKMCERMQVTLSNVGHASYEKLLQPGETCVLPYHDHPTQYLVFHEFKHQTEQFTLDGKPFWLLLVIEVFESEMRYAIEHGHRALFDLLKEKGHYPYSDLDRKPVV